MAARSTPTTKSSMGSNSNSNRSKSYQIEKLDDSSEQAEIQSLRKEMDSFSTAMNDQLEKIKKLREQSTKHRDEILSSIKYLKEDWNGKFEQAKQKRLSLTNELQNLKNQKIQLGDEISNMRKSFPNIKSARNTSQEDYIEKVREAFTKEISELEAQLRSVSSTQEQRQVVSKLESLKTKKSSLNSFAEKVNNLENIKQSLDKIIAELNDCNISKDALLEERKKIDTRIDDNKQKQQKIDNQIKQLEKDRNVTKEKYVKTKEEVKTKKDALNDKWSSWKEEVRTQREKYEEDRKRAAAERLEKEKKKLVNKRKKALANPFSAELKTCQELHETLKELEQANSNNKSKNSPFILDFQTIVAFEKLSIMPPNSADQIEQAINDINAKIDEFSAERKSIVGEKPDRKNKGDNVSENQSSGAEETNENNTAEENESQPDEEPEEEKEDEKLEQGTEETANNNDTD